MMLPHWTGWNNKIFDLELHCVVLVQNNSRMELELERSEGIRQVICYDMDGNENVNVDGLWIHGQDFCRWLDSDLAVVQCVCLDMSWTISFV